MVKELPLKTILSSQANRFRGAAFLSGVQDGIVVEIGETTTNVGVIKCGHPSECLRDFKVYIATHVAPQQCNNMCVALIFYKADVIVHAKLCTFHIAM